MILFSFIIKMTQYNTLNVRFPNSQLKKLKSVTKNGTKLTLDLSSNLIGISNDDTNCPLCIKILIHNISFPQILLTDTQLSKIRNTFADGSSANITFSKTHLSKIILSGGFLTDISGIIDSIDPRKILPKSANKAEDFSKKLTFNDILKTADTSKKFIKNV